MKVIALSPPIYPVEKRMPRNPYFRVRVVEREFQGFVVESFHRHLGQWFTLARSRELAPAMKHFEWIVVGAQALRNEGVMMPNYGRRNYPSSPRLVGA